MDKITGKQRQKLLTMLKEYFSESELEGIQFALGIDYETVPGKDKSAKARELILHLERRDRIDELLSLCKQDRPNISWQLKEPPFSPFDGNHYLYSLSDEEVDQLLTSGRLLEEAGLVNEAAAKYWRVKQARPNHSDIDQRLTSLENLPKKEFIGRSEETETLLSLLEKSMMGTSSVAFLSGEAGIGKTSLVYEFFRKSQVKYDGLIYLASSCSVQSGFGEPYLPFKEMIFLLCGEIENQLSQASVSITNAKRIVQNTPFVLATLVDFSPSLISTFLPNLLAKFQNPERDDKDFPGGEQYSIVSESPISAYSNSIKHTVVYELLLVFRKLTERFPLVVFLDDLQWADLASVDLLCYLASKMHDRPIMFIGSFRSEEDTETKKALGNCISGIRTRFPDTTKTINLDTLDDKFAMLYADKHYPNNDFPIHFIAQVQDHTSNNALFVSELFHLLEEQGSIYQDSRGVWHLGKKFSLEAIPEKVETVIEKRLENLTSELRTILLTASIEGEEFSARTIAQLQGVSERDLIAKLTEELEKKRHLVALSRAAMLNQQWVHIYRFKHALIRTYLYQSIPPVKREFLHRDIGLLLEGLHGNETAKLSSVLAEHFRKGKLPEKEIVYRLIAAKEASSVGAWKTAIYHLNLLEERLDDQSIAIQDRSDEMAMEMYMLRGNLYALIPDPDKASDNYKQLQTIATAHESKCYLAYAFMGYGILERALGNFAKAIVFAEYAREIVDEATCPNVFADCYLLIAKSHKDLAQYADVLEWAEKAKDAYEKMGNLIGILDSRSQIAYAHYAQGNYVVAESIWETNLYEAPEYASLPPDPDDDVYFCLGFLNWRLGKHKKAHHYLSTALESARKVNYRRKEAYCLNNLGFVETSLGNFDRAEEILTNALTIFQELGDKKGESWAYGNLGNVMFHYGKYDQAIHFLQQNLALAKEIGLKSDSAEANRRLSEAYLHDGKLSEAYRHAQQGLQEAEKLGRRAFIGMIYRIMGDIAVKAAFYQQDGFSEIGKPEEYFGMSVKIARETQSYSEEYLSLEAWGKYLISLNDGESKIKGEELLKQAEQLKG